jgi:Asp-tRNA(Asn)/Glu-tRNA(Gln) amidotransferase A subunit family amidase
MKLPITAAAAAMLAWQAATPARIAIDEITIAGLQSALRNGRATCRDVVGEYLRRIETYDKRGPAINAIVAINPKALDAAADLDQRFARSGPVGPLHCVPVIVKDNYETIEMPTTAGSLALKDMMTGRDAFVVARLRAAGAVMIAKSNMAEFAFTQYETVNSILPGYTRNPYDTARVTAGSSGGTAAAVAANFGLVGLGTDTGASIRGPAAHQALVGLRPTMGLTSRSGVVPVFLDSDVTGPMTRTVADAAIVLQAIAGEDPADTATAASRGRGEAAYVDAARGEPVNGLRVGVLHQAYDTPTSDPEVIALFGRAVEDLRRLGVDVVDPVEVPNLDDLRRGGAAFGGCNTFQAELNHYLASVGDRAPKRTLEQIVASRQFHPSIQPRLEASLAAKDVPGVSPGCVARTERRSRLREAVGRLMAERRIDALLYPTWSNAPRLIGDLNTPHGDNNQLFSPGTGFPAITVPMGYSHGMLPAGLQLLGPAWSEATLIRLAAAYEQATHHRRPPPSTPPLAPAPWSP